MMTETTGDRSDLVPLCPPTVSNRQLTVGNQPAALYNQGLNLLFNPFQTALNIGSQCRPIHVHVVHFTEDVIII